ncbi:MAG TPA: hypothetical protein VLD57_03710, partial [Blastocatellia bacterium]|nr:hypothetical protein [Blastocatellia bacterium]
MILYYALGGGLGHLTRARAVLHTLSIQDRVVILASSPFAKDARVTGGREVILVPAESSSDPAGYRSWLAEQIERLSPSKILLDTFPAGIIGEFCDFSFSCCPELLHIARLLRWSDYSRQLRGAPPLLDLTYMIEPLAAEHEDYLRSHSVEVREISFDNIRENPSREALEAADRLKLEEKLVWLIVHSGPNEETLELVS